MVSSNGVRTLWIAVASSAVAFAGRDSALADVFPASTSGWARTIAVTFPNAPQPWDSDSYFGSTGDFAASAHQYDSTEAISTPYLECDLSGTSSGHVDASGASGNAELTTHWIAVNPFPLPNSQSGAFDSDNYFYYSFITDTAGTITIDVTTTSNLPNIDPPDPEDPVNYAMAINHTVTFNGTYTVLLLNGHETLVYSIGPGFHQLLLEHHPNSGIAPWPNCDVYSNTNMTFTIETEPTPVFLGDMDCDLDVDLDDVPAMQLALLDPDLYTEFYGCIDNGDFTADSLVDGADIQGFVSTLVGG